MGWVMNNQTITEVSRVTSITGVAKIKMPDGELKEIHVGDILQPGTVVVTVHPSPIDSRM